MRSPVARLTVVHCHEACDPETCELTDTLSPEDRSASGRLPFGLFSPTVAPHSQVETLTFLEGHSDPVIADHESGVKTGGGLRELNLNGCRICVPRVRHQLCNRVDGALVHLNPQVFDHTAVKHEVKLLFGRGHSFLGCRAFGHVTLFLWFTIRRFQPVRW